MQNPELLAEAWTNLKSQVLSSNKDLGVKIPKFHGFNKFVIIQCPECWFCTWRFAFNDSTLIAKNQTDYKKHGNKLFLSNHSWIICDKL